MLKIRIATLLSLGVLATGFSPAASAPTCQSESYARAGGRWTTKPLPMTNATTRFRASQVVNDPGDPGVILATDGLGVIRTTDSGCTWNEVWRIPAATNTDPQYAEFKNYAQLRIVEMHTAETNVDAPWYLLLRGATSGQGTVLTTAGASQETHLMRSMDNGATWQVWDGTGDKKIPQFRAAQLTMASSDLNRLYLSVNATKIFPKVENLFVSKDGGRTWDGINTGVEDPAEDLNRALDYLSRGQVAENSCSPCTLKVDPFKADEIWGYSLYSIYRSKDGGRKFTHVRINDGYMNGATDIDIFRTSTVHRIVISSSGECTAIAWRCLFRSDDGGRSWQVLPETIVWSYDNGEVPPRIANVEFGRTREDVIGFGGVGQSASVMWRIPQNGDRWIDLEDPFVFSYPLGGDYTFRLAGADLSSDRWYAWTAYSLEVFRA